MKTVLGSVEVAAYTALIIALLAFGLGLGALSCAVIALVK